MKAIQITRKGPPETLRLVDVDEPAPGPEDVLIKVAAAGVNFADVLARQGLYPDAPPLPFIPGYEVAGTVVSFGKDTVKFRKNDRVVAFTRFGGYAEYAIAPELAVRHLPDHIGFGEAAGFPVNYTTAYHCLFQTGTFHNGSKVLIHAAAGGVGQAAIQLCKLKNCEIFGTTGSPHKLELLSKLGVQHPINIRTEDFVKQVQKKAPGKQIDIILDSIGGSSIIKGLSLLKPHGRLITFGFASISGKNKLKILWTVMRMKNINPIALLAKSKGVYGVNILHVFEHNPLIAADSFNSVYDMLMEKTIEPPAVSIIPFHLAAEAHRKLQCRESTGKLVLGI